MPTLSEFILTVQLRREEESGRMVTVFRFRTQREFRSFRYEIQVDDEFNLPGRLIDFQIRGVRAPANLMPATGSATREFCYPGLSGAFTVTVSGARQSASFSFTIRGNKIRLLEVEGSDFVSVAVIDQVEHVRA